VGVNWFKKGKSGWVANFIDYLLKQAVSSAAFKKLFLSVSQLMNG